MVKFAGISLFRKAPVHSALYISPFCLILHQLALIVI